LESVLNVVTLNVISFYLGVLMVTPLQDYKFLNKGRTKAGMMQRLIRDLNCATGGKFQSILPKRAQNNREIDPIIVMLERAPVFQVSVQNRQNFLVLSYVLRCEWLPERARWSPLPAGETTHRIPQKEFARKPYNKCFLDQVCSVKMAGYYPRSLLASLWNSTQSAIDID